MSQQVAFAAGVKHERVDRQCEQEKVNNQSYDQTRRVDEEDISVNNRQTQYLFEYWE